MITTLTVTLMGGRYAEDDWKAVIEIDEDAMLHDLHQIILREVRFSNDHLYAFFVARDIWSRDRDFVVDIEEDVTMVPIKNMFPLPARKSLFYLFDWGDEWIFRITPSRKRPVEPVKRRKYPRVESTQGKRPKQYVYDY